MRKVTSNVGSSARRTGSPRSIHSHVRLCIAGLFALVALLAFSSSAMAAPNTTVSFTFDDGRPSQLAAAQQLANRGMKATFFIISSTVGQPGVMSVSDLNTLKASGMEIGAHTVFHRDLQNLTSDEAKRELCLSRNWLMDRGFDVYDMAYPYDSTNASVKQLVAACGYNGARSGGQLQCDANHACSETVPPLDTYSIRTPQRARDDDDARRHEGDGHQRREQRRRMGAARDPRHLRRPERSAPAGRRTVLRAGHGQPRRSSTSSSTGSRARSTPAACRSRPSTRSSAARCSRRPRSRRLRCARATCS